MILDSGMRTPRAVPQAPRSLRSRERCARLAALALLAPLVVCLFAPPAAATSVRRTVVLVANMLDAPVPASSQQIRDVLFEGPTSVAAFFAAATYGNVTFSGIVLDPVTIPYTSTSTCLYLDWADAARQAATTQYNVDFAQYDNLVYVLPPCQFCGLDGVAIIGGRHSWNFGKPLVAGIYSHELGHNLGLAHANTPGVEGGDFSTTMGFSDELTPFNAPERDAAGWVPPGRSLDVAATGLYRIAPLESTAGSDPLVLKIIATAAQERYYISYRRPVGFDASLPAEFHDKVSIHKSLGAGATTLVAVLDDGQGFSDPQGNVFIRVIDHNDAFAAVNVTRAPTVVAPADFNFDGVVSAADLAQWRGDFGVNAGSDADRDGDSDGADFVSWQHSLDEIGRAEPRAAASLRSIPEPGGFVLAAVAVVIASRAPRRRRA